MAYCVGKPSTFSEAGNVLPGVPSQQVLLSMHCPGCVSFCMYTLHGKTATTFFFLAFSMWHIHYWNRMFNDNPSTTDWIVKSGHQNGARYTIQKKSRRGRENFCNLIKDNEGTFHLFAESTCMWERNKQACGDSSNYMRIVSFKCWTIIRS